MKRNTGLRRILTAGMMTLLLLFAAAFARTAFAAGAEGPSLTVPASIQLGPDFKVTASWPKEGNSWLDYYHNVYIYEDIDEQTSRQVGVAQVYNGEETGVSTASLERAMIKSVLSICSLMDGLRRR